MFRDISITNILFILVLGIAFSFCQKISDEDLDDVNSKDKPISLSVSARSQNNSDIEYPMFAYAFNEEGKMLAYQKIESKNDSIYFNLGKGTYTVAAIAGCNNEYVINESPSINDIIKFKNESYNYAKESMMMGISQINVDKKDVNVILSMSYCVSSIEVSLNNIPFGTKKVEASISPLYNAISYNGQYQKTNNSNELTMNCYLGIDGIWKAGPVYIFPGCNNTTTFKITIEKESSINTYSYLYKGAPKASQPFILNGTLAGDVKVNGNILTSGWGDAILVDFDFSSSSGQGNPDEEGNNENNPPIGTPQAGEIWNGCIVADVNGTNLFLLSMEEWECTYDEAETLASEYSINGISGWSLPSWEQATFLKKVYNGEKLEELNNKLKAVSKEIILSDSDSRFLCYNKDGNIYTFRFAKGTNIVKPKSDDTYTYYLRVVKSYSLK